MDYEYAISLRVGNQLRAPIGLVIDAASCGALFLYVYQHRKYYTCEIIGE